MPIKKSSRMPVLASVTILFLLVAGFLIWKSRKPEDETVPKPGVVVKLPPIEPGPEKHEFEWSVGGSDQRDGIIRIADCAPFGDGDVAVIGTFFEKAINDSADAEKQTQVSEQDQGEAGLAVYNDNGQLLWMKSIRSTDGVGTKKVLVRKSGEIYVVGTYKGRLSLETSPAKYHEIPGDPEHLSAFICAYDKKGDLLWAKSIKQRGNNIPERGYGNPKILVTACLSSDERVLVSGGVNSDLEIGTPESIDFMSVEHYTHPVSYVCKFDEMGNPLWVVLPEAESGSAFLALAPTADGGVRAGGWFMNEIAFNRASENPVTLERMNGRRSPLIVRFDGQGNVLEAQALGSEELAGEVAVLNTLPEGDMVIAAHCSGEWGAENRSDQREQTRRNPQEPANTAKLLLARLDTDYNITWERDITGTRGRSPEVKNGQQFISPNGHIYTLLKATAGLIYAIDEENIGQERSRFPVSYLMRYDLNGKFVDFVNFGDERAFRTSLCVPFQNNRGLFAGGRLLRNAQIQDAKGQIIKGASEGSTVSDILIRCDYSVQNENEPGAFTGDIVSSQK